MNRFKLCKKIGESLIEQRNELEKRLKEQNDIEQMVLAQKAAKVDLLIESVKKKLNIQFENEEANQSIGKIGQVVELEKSLDSAESLLRPDEQLDKTIGSSEIDKNTTGTREHDDEESERTRRELEEEKHRLDAFKLEEEEKLRREKEKLEQEKNAMNVEKEKIELEKLKLENERVQREKSQSGDGEANQKIVELIDLMKKQKLQHLQMNIDTLNEQYELIRTQNKQIEYEIKHINKSSNRRMVRNRFSVIWTNF